MMKECGGQPTIHCGDGRHTPQLRAEDADVMEMILDSDEELSVFPIDWHAAGWTLTDVYNAFLRPDFLRLKLGSEAGGLTAILQALRQEVKTQGVTASHADFLHRLRAVLQHSGITPSETTKLHPAMWLRLLHWGCECLGGRLTVLEKSYKEWRKSHENSFLQVGQKIASSGKWRFLPVDVFLLRSVDVDEEHEKLSLDLKDTYQWRLKRDNSEVPARAKKEDDTPQKKALKHAKRDPVEAIGREVCATVLEMLNEGNRIPLLCSRASTGLNQINPDKRKFKYQGSSTALANHLMSRKNSQISNRSITVVAKAVRHYVKCS